MDCELHEPTLFQNRDWRLSASGLEHKGNGYFIEAAQIGDKRSDGRWAWPAHMAEKIWCESGSFNQAFAQALGLFGHGTNAVGISLAQADCRRQNFGEGAPRRLGELAAAQLAALGAQAVEVEVEVTRGPRRGESNTDTAGGTARPMRRAA